MEHTLQSCMGIEDMNPLQLIKCIARFGTNRDFGTLKKQRKPALQRAIELELMRLRQGFPPMIAQNTLHKNHRN